MPGKISRLIWCLFRGVRHLLTSIGRNERNICFHLCTCNRTSELEETEFFSFHSGVKRGDIIGICGYPGLLACLALIVQLPHPSPIFERDRPILDSRVLWMMP